jgi:hypothetical protein
MRKGIRKSLLLALITGGARARAPHPRCRKVELLTNWVCLPPLTLNFKLPQCSTSQFSASSLPTSHNDSFPTNCVSNPLDGESDEFVSTDSEGYVETEVDWFDEPQLVETAKQRTSKMSEAVALEVSLCYVFPPYTDCLSLEATLG